MQIEAYMHTYTILNSGSLCKRKHGVSVTLRLAYFTKHDFQLHPSPAHTWFHFSLQIHEIPPRARTTCCLFIHVLMGIFDCCYFLSAMDKVAINIDKRASSVQSSQYPPRSGTAGCEVVCVCGVQSSIRVLAFVETSNGAMTITWLRDHVNLTDRE